MAPITTARTVRVLVVDDHPLFRKGVASALESDGAIDIVGMTGSVKEALGEVARLRPDVVLVDLNLGDGSGVDLCAGIRERHPQARMIVVTRSTVHRYVVEAFEAGVAGYVVKTTEPDDILHAIRAVADEGTFIDPCVADSLIRQALKGRERGRPFGLTRQETAVLELVGHTVGVEAIGEQLDMSAQTVETHLAHAMRKLGVDDPHEAARILRRQQSL